MFYEIYKTTIKNLFRSVIFWLSFLIIIGITIFSVSQGHRIMSDTAIGIMIRDTDPRYVMNFEYYIIDIFNVFNSKIMLHSIPIFSIISTAIILAHNHRDEFFEIEKASGINLAKYTFGKILAILSINLIITLIVVHIGVHFYVHICGGVEYMGTFMYISDSAVRILRLVLFQAMPTITMYVGITYLVGTVFKSVFPAAITSIGYVVFYFSGMFVLRNRIVPIYFDYFSPSPRKLVDYLYYYDSAFFEWYINSRETSFGKAAFCVLFLVAVGATGILISYLLTRKRDK